MPSTAHNPGFGIPPVTAETPSEYNRVGNAYDAAMYNRYGGDPAKVYGAYNMGPGAMDRRLAQYGDGWLNHSPLETRKYVANNMSLYQRNH